MTGKLGNYMRVVPGATDALVVAIKCVGHICVLRYGYIFNAQFCTCCDIAFKFYLETPPPFSVTSLDGNSEIPTIAPVVRWSIYRSVTDTSTE